jgi:excinuclease ABC subunit A
MEVSEIKVSGASEHNLKNIDIIVPRGKITVVTGVSGSGKSSLAFDTILAECHRRFFYTLSNYSRQFLDLGTRPRVRKVSGLSPAIALEQNETKPSRRASVGTLTDLSELLGVVFANFSDKHCPTHGLKTTVMTRAEVVKHISSRFEGQILAITSPIAENKKGIFKKEFTQAFEAGFTKAFVDGKTVDIETPPKLEREVKHTIKVVIDYVKVTAGKLGRLEQAIEKAQDMSDGFAEYYISDKAGHIDLKSGGSASRRDGCPSCGFSWPKLDSRYFSANSVGRCSHCFGFGLEPDLYDFEDESQLASIEGGQGDHCKVCSGTGLNPKYDAIKFQGQTMGSLMQLSILDLHRFALSLRGSVAAENAAFLRVYEKIVDGLQRIIDVGLGYLSLSRRVLTLSGGESQRLRLAGILSESLRGVLYVLDEPSQGLHPTELEALWKNINRLRDLGNTILVVDHDEFMIRMSDWVIDLGPGGGALGGFLQAQFDPKDAQKFSKVSLTAKHLEELQTLRPKSPRSPKGFISMEQVDYQNLKKVNVRFAKGTLNVVTGVSGAGKSSLVFGSLIPNLESIFAAQKAKEPAPTLQNCLSLSGLESFQLLRVVDRSPVGKSSVSMPVTYLDLMTYLRGVYAKLPEAQLAGLDVKDFSLMSAGGRCEECKGRGEVVLSMRFLADARERCPVCSGKRYKETILDIKYNGHSLSQVLDLTLAEVGDLFIHHRQITRALKPAIDLGLGYLKLGQTSASLSGGEAQRLKLVPILSKEFGSKTILILDEPTRGLHFSDVAKLMDSLGKLVDLGTTIIMIEHNPEVIYKADWVVDLGPGAAELGGKVVYQGEISGLKSSKSSLTGQYLQSAFKE